MYTATTVEFTDPDGSVSTFATPYGVHLSYAETDPPGGETTLAVTAITKKDSVPASLRP